MADPQTLASKSQMISNGLIPRSPSHTQGLLSSSSTASPGRLESFRPPRDLSLGAPGPSAPAKTKRKFEPCIPKNKPKAKPSTSSYGEELPKKKEKKEWKGNKKGRGGPGGGRGRGRGGGVTYIQTVGSVFGEGIHVTPVQRVKERYECKTSYKKTDIGRKPFYKKPKKKEVLEDGEVELKKVCDDPHQDDDVVRTMKRWDFIDDQDHKPKPGDRAPVFVPFRKHAKGVKMELKTEIKTEPLNQPIIVNGVKIKVEKQEVVDGPTEEDPDDPMVVDTNPEEDVKPSLDFLLDALEKPLPEKSAEDILFNSPASEMFLLQLPDCLPGHVEAEPEPKAASSTQDTHPSSSRGSAPCTLKNLSEGVIGHIEVLKSGKVRLNLGNDRIMYLNAGTPTPTRQEVVSVEVDEQARQGSMKVLGEVVSRLICTPDWRTELRKMKQHRKTS